MRKNYAYYNDEHIEEKKYLQVYVCDAIQRETANSELAWSDLTDHHLFRGNDTMMVFERFYYDGNTIEELQEERNDTLAKLDIDATIFDTMTTNELYEFRNARNYKNDYEIQMNMAQIEILKYLEANGYTLEKLDKYDGVLLNITW